MINPFQDLIQAPRLLCPAKKNGVDHPATTIKRVAPQAPPPPHPPPSPRRSGRAPRLPPPPGRRSPSARDRCRRQPRQQALHRLPVGGPREIQQQRPQQPGICSIDSRGIAAGPSTSDTNDDPSWKPAGDQPAFIRLML